ncbi:hypothetical protein [Flavobacterium humi]|uniref:Uncharacterized protein n=1 Tax=Flavobacterium humi TaxID=2562683 RepID=A0A4Z0L5V8_9FLAO|nr:hypothetical protein [Flavobacterium humi]TGD56949.1 hypothetical protein E4635_14240 [Flavobacterium humi]
MKFLTRIVLGIFILFQFSSVIVCVINERSKTNFAYTITEEEEHSHSKQVKEVKSEFVVLNHKLIIPFDEMPSKKVHDYYLLKHYVTNPTIFLLPPEQV